MGNTTTFMPTKVRLRSCTLNGVSLYQYTQNIKVYESMCTPYIKCELTIIDNNGIIAGIAERSSSSLAGMPVTFAFDDGETVYERTEQTVLTVDAQPSEANKRVQVYTIGTIGVSYLNDRKSLVQKSFVNTNATNAAGQIHNQYIGTDAGLRLLSASIGMIAKDSIGSFPISNVKPWKAIEDILRNRVTYGSAANPTVYFRDRSSYVMGPLQDIFRQASPAVTVVEKATWGTTVHDMFVNAHYAIVAATLIVKKEDAAQKGHTKIHHSAAAAMQSLNIWDQAGSKIAMEFGAKATGIAGIVTSLAGGASKLGGSMNNLIFNSLRNDLSSEPALKRTQEQAFMASVADADKYLVKVPIRAGLKLTAGGGVDARILAPAGASDRARVVGGNMLVADVMHDCYFDKREAQAFTTFRGVKIGDVL